MSARTLLILLAAAVTTHAQAAAEREFVAAIAVPVKDLDLSTERGLQDALARLDEAAYHACGGDPAFHPSHKSMPRYTEQVFRECREDAVARAVSDFANPALSQARAARLPADASRRR